MDPTVWEAARATSALPDLFKPVTIGTLGTSFVAAIRTSNPIDIVLEEARGHFGFDREIACAISVGSGKRDVISLKQGDDLKETLARIVADCETAAVAADRKLHGQSIYYRFNVEQGLQSRAHHDWERLDEIATHTTVYLNERAVSDAMDAAVRAIIERTAVCETNERRNHADMKQPKVKGNLSDVEEQRVAALIAQTLKPVQAPSLVHNVGLLPGTREFLKGDIARWLKDDQPVYWLGDVAGTGKTTVVRYFVQEWTLSGELGASLFFSRSNVETHRTFRIGSHLALQIQARWPAFRTALATRLKDYPTIGTLPSSKLQYQYLLLDPLREAATCDPRTTPLIIAIDALDELADTPERQCFFDLLAELTRPDMAHVRLKLLLTSRIDKSTPHEADVVSRMSTVSKDQKVFGDSQPTFTFMSSHACMGL